MDLPFWEGAVQGKLLVQRCNDCNRYYWPVSICVQCSNRDLEWVEATGRGAVYTLTVIHPALSADLRCEHPYNVPVVELEEGPLMFINIVDCPSDQIEVGMPVEVTFKEMETGGSVPEFRPVQS